MKMMSKVLSIFLAAAISALCWLPSAHALRPKPDFFVHVVNATGQTIEVCTVDLKQCDTVLPGAMSVDAQATASLDIVPIDPWIADTVVRGCGKIIPLKRVVSAPRAVKDSKAVTYSLAVSKELYSRECATVGR